MSHATEQPVNSYPVLQGVITELCLKLPVTGAAILLAKVEEAASCPLVLAGCLHGSLHHADVKTLQRLLLAATQLQEQLVKVLSERLEHQMTASVLAAEQASQRLYNLQHSAQELEQSLAELSRQEAAKEQELRVLEQQRESLRQEVLTSLNPG